MKRKPMKTKDLSANAADHKSRFFPHEYRAQLNGYDSGWRRELRDALLALKALVPDGQTAGATIERRDKE